MGVSVRTRIRRRNALLATERTEMLLVRLHDDQTPDAEGVATAELDGTPLDVHAHGTRVVVDLGYVREDLGVYFCADGLGQVLGEAGVGDGGGQG